MEATFTVNKREGSSVCTRNGALCEAVSSSSLDWSIIDTNGILDSLTSSRCLRSHLNRASDKKMMVKKNSTFQELENAGVFDSFTVKEYSNKFVVRCELI